MTLAHIAARNRANAAKSTGPKTHAGKATSSKNARRHGATGAPDARRVASWLSIILWRPQMTPNDLMPKDAGAELALNLAMAEARLSAALEALSALAEESEEDDNFNDLVKTALDAAFDTSIHISERRAIIDDITQLSRLRMSKATEHARRHRLLTRYAREARSARSRAIAAWSAHTAGSRNQAGAGS
jgi:hypothetical protein